jgi:hypothetical protein
MAMPFSARGPRRDVDSLSGNKNGSLTPRPGSSLKMAGMDVSNGNKQPITTQPLPRGGNKGVDTVPHIPVSGKPGEVAPWCCEPNMILPTPQTPQDRSQVLVRHKRRAEPGQITVHWGLQTVDKPDPGDGYGVKSKKGESVAQNFRSGQKLGIEEYMQSRGEAIYHSVRCEPLSGSFLRGHNLPEFTAQKEFKGFGKELARDAFDAKECIFPRYLPPEVEEDIERYKQTHGSYDPGEKMSRKYEWPDKVTSNEHFRFGVVDQIGGLQSGKGAKTVLTMDMEDDGTFPRTRVVKSTSENYKIVASDRLGVSRNLLQGVPPVPAGHAFGIRSGQDMLHAGELVRGFYSPDEQKPDPDLGKCLMKGRRNFQTKRPFGMPTIRKDLEPPIFHKRSVASNTNYGDDHDAAGLIYPQKFGHRGISDNDFSRRRSPDEVRKLTQNAGYTLQDDEFQMIWDACVEFFGDGSSLVSLQVFLHMLSDWMSQTEGSYARSTQKGTELMPPADETQVLPASNAPQPEPTPVGTPLATPVV